MKSPTLRLVFNFALAITVATSLFFALHWLGETHGSHIRNFESANQYRASFEQHLRQQYTKSIVTALAKESMTAATLKSTLIKQEETLKQLSAVLPKAGAYPDHWDHLLDAGSAWSVIPRLLQLAAAACCTLALFFVGAAALPKNADDFLKLFSAEKKDSNGVHAPMQVALLIIGGASALYVAPSLDLSTDPLVYRKASSPLAPPEILPVLETIAADLNTLNETMSTSSENIRLIAESLPCQPVENGPACPSIPVSAEFGKNTRELLRKELGAFAKANQEHFEKLDQKFDSGVSDVTSSLLTFRD